MLFMKQMALPKISRVFFSGQDRKIAAKIIRVLAQPVQSADVQVKEILDKREHWLVNGIQRLNLKQIVYLTDLIRIFSGKGSLSEREDLAAEIAHFAAEINQRKSPEVNTALLLLPWQILSAYQQGDGRKILQAVSDFRQTFEQPMYVKNLLRPFGTMRTAGAQLTAQTITLVRDMAAQNRYPRTDFRQAVRRWYRDLNPALRDPARVILSAGLTAGIFILFPALAYPKLNFLPGPLTNVLIFNLALNVGTNSIMLWVSANGLRFWNYRFGDLKGVKLSQSAMYSSLGLPLTQLSSFGARSLLAALGVHSQLAVKVLVLFLVGLVGALYTFWNNKIRGKSAQECRFNTFRPLAGSGAALVVAGILNIPADFLTVLSKICDNAYRFLGEGLLNYRAYKAFIRKNLNQVYPKNYAGLSAKELEDKLVKFNIETVSFIRSPGGISSVQDYLGTLDTQILIKLFQKLGQDRSKHLANIQKYSYTDSRRAENYFSDTYYVYRLLLARAIRRTARISLRSPDSTRAELAGLKKRLANLTAAQIRALRADTLQKSFSGIQQMSARQINTALLELGLLFGRPVFAVIREYLDVLSEEVLVAGIIDWLSRNFCPAERRTARRILKIYLAILVQKTNSEKNRHLVYQGFARSRR